MRRGRGLYAALAALVVVGLGSGVALVVTGGGGEASADVLEPRSIRLEPAGAPTPDPFMEESLDLGGADVINLGEPPSFDDDATTGLSGQTTTGDTAGLYGGSQDTAVCDVDRQVAFFEDPANADKAEAWAAAQGIAGEQLGDFLRGLAPVRLRVDTRVTNHSFRDGRARPFQSVLQAGTAVLVDERGVPRSKCFCGNPLTPPVTTDADLDTGEAFDVEELAENPQDAWEGFDPATVLVVEPSPEPLATISVIDPATGEIVEIPVGGPVQAEDTGGGGGDESSSGDENCESVTVTSVNENGDVVIMEERRECDSTSGAEVALPPCGDMSDPGEQRRAEQGECDPSAGAETTVGPPDTAAEAEARRECERDPTSPACDQIPG